MSPKRLTADFPFILLLSRAKDPCGNGRADKLAASSRDMLVSATGGAAAECAGRGEVIPREAGFAVEAEPANDAKVREPKFPEKSIGLADGERSIGSCPFFVAGFVGDAVGPPPCFTATAPSRRRPGRSH
jgi:hypothetical protein